MSSNSGHGHAHGLPANSPMEKIREKELELRGKYLEVKKQAELIVAEARKKANEIKRSATEVAVNESKKYFDEKVIQIRNETIHFGEEEIENINKIAEKNYSKARGFISQQVFPE